MVLQGGQLQGRQQLQGFHAQDEARRDRDPDRFGKGRSKPILDAKPARGTPIVGKPRPFVKNWTLDELVPVVEKGLTGSRL